MEFFHKKSNRKHESKCPRMGYYRRRNAFRRSCVAFPPVFFAFCLFPRAKKTQENEPNEEESDKHSLERTFILQLKLWIDRYALPALSSRDEVVTLKRQLIQSIEEANQLEEECAQLAGENEGMEDRAKVLEQRIEAMVKAFLFVSPRFYPTKT